MQILECAIALHFMHYNFGRIHKALRVTPEIAAEISDHVWSFEEFAALTEWGLCGLLPLPRGFCEIELFNFLLIKLVQAIN